MGGDFVLPEDLLIEILIWLPVVSLLRFKTVCKLWRATIESTQLKDRSCYKRKYHEELIDNADRMRTPGKHILAVDEFIGKPVSDNKTEHLKSNKLLVNELLSCKPRENLQFLGCVLLYEQAFEQSFYMKKTASGKTFPDVMRVNGVLLGIEVDKGLGLDLLLAQRCRHYYRMGARFAKWRAVLKIGPDEPSQSAIDENAKGLAKFAIICQENGLVPIVQSDILVDGSHGIERCADVTEWVLAACYKALKNHHVLLEGTLLMSNMVTPGSESADKVSHEVIAEYTVGALRETVPAAVPAVVFLSGGQSEEEARLSLNAMNKKHSWLLSRSFGCTLQQGSLTSTLKPWCRANYKATIGVYN
ncbi:hypothetical protein MKW94_023271 [Papaver nudicaule]|uniref:fructose-bisphosphate aldolase n=1 Tax=Papaver nudicaule TaxID=74823 RepID=A0AA41VSI9_PAPNU|nr:hypothetical protein [Papaver nudicaule]